MWYIVGQRYYYANWPYILPFSEKEQKKEREIKYICVYKKSGAHSSWNYYFYVLLLLLLLFLLPLFSSFVHSVVKMMRWLASRAAALCVLAERENFPTFLPKTSPVFIFMSGVRMKFAVCTDESETNGHHAQHCKFLVFYFLEEKMCRRFSSKFKIRRKIAIKGGINDLNALNI